MDNSIRVVDLSDDERWYLNRLHPELRTDEPAFVVSAPPAVLSRIRALLREVPEGRQSSQKRVDARTSGLSSSVPRESQAIEGRQQAASREEFLKTVPCLTSAGVAQLSHSSATDPAAPANRWKEEGRLFALSVGGSDYYPAFQFDRDGNPFPAVAEIVEIFADRSSWTLALWFFSNSGWLGGRRPMDLLASEPQRVVEAARRWTDPVDS